MEEVRQGGGEHDTREGGSEGGRGTGRGEMKDGRQVGESMV